jgi:thiol-disulfide isomerase/thioredoxin
MRSMIYGALLLAACSNEPPNEPTEPVNNDNPPPSATADADGDYLTDVEEAELGTDPNNPDSDGDTYLDGDEVLEETDPLDPASVIYQGGWPYQRDKDQIEDPGFSGNAAVGLVMPRLVTVDQFGDDIDLYDFAFHGKPVVVDFSAGWCEACKDIAAWLDGEPSNLMLGPEYDPIIDAVNAGEIYWITVLFEDTAAAPADAAYAAAWFDEYPNPNVAVVVDNDFALVGHFAPGSFPSIQVIDEDMTVSFYDQYDYKPALDALIGK